MHGIGMDHPSTGAQNHQEMVSHDQTMLVCSKVLDNKKPRPANQQALKCPRCDSSNTKFCYYNNYSLTQPRYFCKSCRRYWTKGGTLRNVPVGGGCRKNKRSSSSSSSNISTSSSSSKLCSPQDHQQPFIPTNLNNPVLHLPCDSTDLSLAFARLQNGQLGFEHHEHDHQFSMLGTHPNNNSTTHGLLDSLRSGFLHESTPITGFQNLYYGDKIENAEIVGGGVNVNVSEEMGNLTYKDLMSNGTTSGATTTAVTVTTVKQEGCNGSVRGGTTTGDGVVGIPMTDWWWRWGEHYG